ncbi:hypothetical protein GN278_03390 [Rhodobacteraceae bacterium Araon29]
MQPTKPRIGFDRFIRLEWATKALEVRNGLAEIAELEAILGEAHSGLAAKKKTRTILNRLWLEPRDDIELFAQRAAEFFNSEREIPPVVLTWGMAIVTYPFFARVIEIVGRLTSLQSECSSAEVHRRMEEVYGEREGTRRMTNMVLQSLADWGIIARHNKGKQIALKEPIYLEGSQVISWIVEACVYTSGRSLSIAAIDYNPLLFPFRLGGSLSYILSGSDALELRVDSAGNQIVTIRD